MPSFTARVNLGSETFETTIELTFPKAYDGFNQAKFVLTTPLILEPNLVGEFPINPSTQGEHVYVIQVGNKDVYRIGWTANVTKELKRLQAGNHHVLKLVIQSSGGYNLAERLKNLFQSKVKGKIGWYKLTLRDLEVIRMELWKTKYVTSPSSSSSQPVARSSPSVPVIKPKSESKKEKVKPESSVPEDEVDDSYVSELKKLVTDPFDAYKSGNYELACELLPKIAPLYRCKLEQFATSKPIVHNSPETVRFLIDVYRQITNKRLETGDLWPTILAIIDKTNCLGNTTKAAKMYHQLVDIFLKYIKSDKRYRYSIGTHHDAFIFKTCSHISHEPVAKISHGFDSSNEPAKISYSDYLLDEDL